MKNVTSLQYRALQTALDAVKEAQSLHVSACNRDVIKSDKVVLGSMAERGTPGNEIYRLLDTAAGWLRDMLEDK